jgi:hypothetical protein
MDDTHFAALCRAVGSATTRRGIVRALAGLPLASAGAHLADDVAAHSPRDRANRRAVPGTVQGEHFRHKKKTYCLNGETIRRYRRKQNKLLAMGATLGKCGSAPCVPATCASLGNVCGAQPDGCGGTLTCLCGVTATPSCDNGTCATCAATCGDSCSTCFNLVDGSTMCGGGNTATDCGQLCTSNAECSPGWFCVSTGTDRATNDTSPWPRGCDGSTSPGVCVSFGACK